MCCGAKTFETFQSNSVPIFPQVADLVFVPFTKNANVDLDQKQASSLDSGQLSGQGKCVDRKTILTMR
jgi:hypothetical protein